MGSVAQFKVKWNLDSFPKENYKKKLLNMLLFRKIDL